ncbi:C6 transcription factor [Penicillium macrosclerotiorum]|uniref:C6 transcription factor n=1 Tax=Penicillium macrosclerotiorum TaxID=303699 RepID=UPI002546E433|nr:C6 transcription factor [Penicillium macrosclerotiorum]KAJ5698010.1 C6 transcription factor [Penicillium macrosclerotiorum]
MPQSKKSVPFKRSCLRCHERKVRCDREHPCSRCLQAKVKCFFPENKRAPRKLKRPPIATILGQIKVLEQEVERLRAPSDINNDDSTFRQSHGISEPIHTQVQTPDTQVSLSGREIREYPAYPNKVGKRIREPQLALDQVSNMVLGAPSAHEPSTSPLHLQSVGILGLNSELEAEARYDQCLQPPQIQALWKLYKDNIAPMIALLHKHSIETMIHDACKKTIANLGIGSETLILAICSSATISATPEQCLSILGQDRDVGIRNFRLAVERALARANLISSQDFQVLQTAVLFLLCLRWLNSRLAWAETAIVIRVAQRQGVH